MAAADEPLDEQIANVLRRERTDAYCDACLALQLHVSLAEAQAAALRVAIATMAFDRKRRACSGCGRTVELTSIR